MNLIIKRFRSSWKILLNKKDNTRSLLITPNYFNSSVNVHNGLTIKKFLIDSNMHKLKLGEFCFTKKLAKFKGGKK